MSKRGYSIKVDITRSDMIRVVEEEGFLQATFLSLAKELSYTKKSLIKDYYFTKGDLNYRFCWRDDFSKQKLLELLNLVITNEDIIDNRKIRHFHGVTTFILSCYPELYSRYSIETVSRKIFNKRIIKILY